MLLFPKATALYDGPLMKQLGDHIDLCKVMTSATPFYKLSLHLTTLSTGML